MSDSLIAKLHRMAEGGTEHEREIARAKLATMAAGDRSPPRRPPAPPAAGPAPEDPGEVWMSFTQAMEGANMSFNGVGAWVRGTARSYNTASRSGTTIEVEFHTGGRTT
jgi:hypothetical protein